MSSYDSYQDRHALYSGKCNKDSKKYKLGAAHKRRPQSNGGRDMSCADILRTKGEGSSSDVDVRTFWCKKTLDFTKFIVCPHGQGGWTSATFCRQRARGSIFNGFVRTSFMEDPFILFLLRLAKNVIFRLKKNCKVSFKIILHSEVVRPIAATRTVRTDFSFNFALGKIELLKITEKRI